MVAPSARAKGVAKALLGTARALGPGALVPWRLGGGLGPVREPDEHLEAALAWLTTAHDACGRAGVPAMYALGRGWGPAYPETSGYLIATFLACARAGKGGDLRQRAVEIGDWELGLQTAGGGVLSSPERAETRVFNTGQVILGLCALEEEVGLGRHLAGAERAGRYLLALQEGDGRWERDTYCGARTYHARVDWGLLRLARLTGDRTFAEAAARNLAWVLRQVQPGGWFARCGFHQDPPITHVLAYTLRGLLECHALDDQALRGLPLLRPVQEAADSLAARLEAACLDGVPGMLPASFERDWSSRSRFSCLTGNAQLSVVFARMAQLEARPDRRSAARTLARAVMRAQRFRRVAPAVHGAVAGSHPLTGGYCTFAFPNWAAKFLADALLFELDGRSSFNVLA